MKEDEVKLAELILNNLGLEVLCSCDEECGGDEPAMGKISWVSIDEYIIADRYNGDSVYYFKSDTDDVKDINDITEGVVNILIAKLGAEIADNLSDAEIVKEFNNVKWTPCIHIYISPK